MSLKEHQDKVKAWRIKYNIPPPDFELPSTIVCFVCKRIKRRMERHHTGFDSIFADMLPDEFAARYVQFKSEDCERLCHYHHQRAHGAYKYLLRAMNEEINKKGMKIITKEWCLGWRDKFRARFYEWAKQYKVRKRKDDD